MAHEDGLGLDFLTQIVNVQWAAGGAIFIYGELLGNKLYRVKVKAKGATPETQIITLPESDTRDFTEENATRFGAYGGSYGKKKQKDKDGNFTIDDKTSEPVFVICGTRGVAKTIKDEVDNDRPVTDSYALIYTSNDGIEWSASHEEAAITASVSELPRASATALVWDIDEQSFYYAQNRAVFHPATAELEAFDDMLSSADGKAWTPEGSQDVVGADETYKSPFLAHTEHNDCIDARDQHVPDGFSTTDATTELTAKPVIPPVVRYEGGGIDYSSGSSEIEIETEDAEGDKETKTLSIPGIGNVTCVAGCNQIFMAGGFVAADDDQSAGAVVISTDNGVTWNELPGTLNGVTFMIVAPMTDFPSEPEPG